MISAYRYGNSKLTYFCRKNFRNDTCPPMLLLNNSPLNVHFIIVFRSSPSALHLENNAAKLALLC